MPRTGVGLTGKKRNEIQVWHSGQSPRRGGGGTGPREADCTVLLFLVMVAQKTQS